MSQGMLKAAKGALARFVATGKGSRSLDDASKHLAPWGQRRSEPQA